MYSRRPFSFMSDDTLHINTRGKASHSYDAIVVGSGISGGWAAKELCEKGLTVLLIERGSDLEHPNYPTATRHPWQFENAGVRTREDLRQYPVQTRHWCFREDNRHFFINDLENPYTEIRRFDWIRADVLGGRSLFWGRHCYRMSDLDFEASQRDGHGADWPIRYRDLAPWYDYVESFVGVSGNRDGIPQLPDGLYQPPMDMNCVERDFKQKMESRFPGRHAIIGRVANLTEAKEGRGKCQFRNLCHRGCPYGGYFSTPSATLPAARKTGNLTVLTNSMVNTVLWNQESRRASGVELVDRTSGKQANYYARLIFLNASTLATSFILLNSISPRFPNGMGNDSGVLGRFLMDNHKGAGARALVEGYEDQYYTGRRANQVLIPRFRNVSKPEKNFLRGYQYIGEAQREGWKRLLDTDELGSDLFTKISEPGPWSIHFGATGESLAYEHNRVTLNTDVKDKWGRNTLNVDARFGENEHNMQKDMANSMAEMLDAAGFRNVESYSTISFPGNNNHEMGTARMGRDPRSSVLNSFNQMHDVPNLFVTDGSCMVSNPCVNPSLTYMALTARACAYAVEELRKGNI